MSLNAGLKVYERFTVELVFPLSALQSVEIPILPLSTSPPSFLSRCHTDE